MKRSIVIKVAAVVVCSILLAKCTTEKNTGETETTEIVSKESKSVEEPLNITVLIDLSDRIIKADGQERRDEAIVNYLFKKIVDKGKFTSLKDAFQIIFYPAPGSDVMDSLSTTMSINLSKIKPLERRKEILKFQQTLESNIPKLYDYTKAHPNWIGCDIWGLFDQKEADILCVKQGYRNVLVILTDGYIYHSENQRKDGQNYSYILDKTLAIPNARLISCPEVQNLEVLVLECNPTTANKFPLMKSVLSEWFDGMQINHYSIHKTDNTANSQSFINNFFD